MGHYYAEMFCQTTLIRHQLSIEDKKVLASLQDYLASREPSFNPQRHIITNATVTWYENEESPPSKTYALHWMLPAIAKEYSPPGTSNLYVFWSRGNVCADEKRV